MPDAYVTAPLDPKDGDGPRNRNPPQEENQCLPTEWVDAKSTENKNTEHTDTAINPIPTVRSAEPAIDGVSPNVSVGPGPNSQASDRRENTKLTSRPKEAKETATVANIDQASSARSNEPLIDQTQSYSQVTVSSSGVILGWPMNMAATTNSGRASPLHTEQRTTSRVSNAIQYSGDRHLVTFAPTGSGKGVGLIIPNLLHYSGSAIVVDPKGENFAITARYRKNVLKQEILLLDPFKIIRESQLKDLELERQRLNPMDVCRFSPKTIDVDSQMLTEMFAGDAQAAADMFWNNSAKRLVSGLMAHEMETALGEGRLPKLSNVITLLFSDDPVYTLAVMLDKGGVSNFAKQAIGGGFLGIDAKETRAGILGYAQSYFSIFASGGVLDHIDNSTINLLNVQGSANYTIYIIVPPNKLESHRAVLRGWVCVLMHAIMERRTRPAQGTLLILDECANLGHLAILRRAVTLVRGYGLQVWMFFQDLAQLEELYPDSGTMINNCGVVQAFGMGRLSGAKPIAKIIGTIRSNELLKMDERQQVLSVLPGSPTIARMVRYYKDEAFAGRFDANPFTPEKQKIRSSVFKPGMRAYSR